MAHIIQTPPRFSPSRSSLRRHLLTSPDSVGAEDFSSSRASPGRPSILLSLAYWWPVAAPRERKSRSNSTRTYNGSSTTTVNRILYERIFHRITSDGDGRIERFLLRAGQSFAFSLLAQDVREVFLVDLLQVPRRRASRTLTEIKATCLSRPSATGPYRPH